MSWLLPWALGAAVAAAIGVALLHLLARDRPPRWLLPTARFVAPGTARATRRARTPQDIPLLLVRMLALLLAGAAFATPVLHPEGGNVAQVQVLDLADERRAGPAVETARARHGDGDRLVVIDTAVHIVPAGSEGVVLDSLAMMATAAATDAQAATATTTADSATIAPRIRGAAGRPTLTAALIAAVRAAALLPPQADSASLVMIAPTGAHDAALARARAAWPGRVTVVDVPIPAGVPVDSTEAVVAARPAVRGPAGDAIVAAARLAGAVLLQPGDAPAVSSMLIVRDRVTAADSAWAAGGGTLLVWPADTAGAGLVPAGRRDTMGGFVAGGHAALLATVRTHAPPDGDAVARWIDGAPAVTQQPHGMGCIRTAAMTMPVGGDVTLRPAFQAALRSLMHRCSSAHPAPIADSTRALLAGTGALARAGALRARSSRSPATPWLLGAALALLLLVEPLLRRRHDQRARASA